MIDSDQHTVVAGERDAQSWPTLLGHVLLDFTRVIEGEARLLRASVEPTMTAVLDRWLLQLVLASVALAGLLLVLGAGVLLLHKWLEWWAAFGIVGVVTLGGAGYGLKGRG
jgi:hypothetical protein